jgi:hypothetical protein
MKYIVTERLTGDHEEEIFIFPNSVDHDCMAEMLGRIKNQSWGNWERVPRVPISAGFVDPFGTCFGRSETLDLDSREADTELLEKTYRTKS